MAILTGTFTSIWDNGTVSTNCTLDTDTGKLSPETAEIVPNDLGSLLEEIFTDGVEDYQVCPICHEYIMKTVINPDGVGIGLTEGLECSNHHCPDSYDSPEPVIEREINKYLCCSTGHMSKEDSEKLRGEPFSHHSYEFGDFIYVNSDEECFKDQIKEYTDAGFSKDFINLIKMTRDIGCVFLQLDCDGPVYDDLPVYDW